jgi:phage gpG-like protein
MPIGLFIDSRALLMFEKDVQELAKKFARRGGMREPLLRIAKEVLSPSISTNFDAAGRPEPWPEADPVSRYRVARFGKGGSMGISPLLVTGQLQRAAGAFARWRVRENTLTYGNFPPSRWYAVVHDDADTAARAGIPVRPFALIQQEDIVPIQDIFLDWIEEKVGESIRLRYP